jgi:hypothetical protein
MNDCQPVFIVGMNGSGTSMMLDSLGRHPELYAVPQETLMMPYIITQAQRFGNLGDDQNFLAYGQFALRQMPALRHTKAVDAIELHDNWLSMPRTIAGVFDGIFGSLAATQGKRRWCEKTPDHVQHIRTLADVFPNSSFVHMIRDGREVASSISRRQLRHPELVIYRWKRLVQEGRSAGALLGGRYLEIRYEDLTADPRRQMQRLCEFLQIPFDEQVLQSRMPQDPRRKRLAQGSLGTISTNPVKWPSYFDAPTLRRLEGIGGRMLTELGYEVRTAAGDGEPTWWQKKRWRAMDFLRYHIELKKKSRRYNTWPKMLGKMYFSFKEYWSKRY